MQRSPLTCVLLSVKLRRQVFGGTSNTNFAFYLQIYIIAKNLGYIYRLLMASGQKYWQHGLLKLIPVVGGRRIELQLSKQRKLPWTPSYLYYIFHELVHNG